MSILEITSSSMEDVSLIILHLKGQLDHDTHHQLVDHARQAHEAGVTHILLDLSGVDMLTSSGLHTIHTVFKMFTPQSDLEPMHLHGDEPYKSPYFKMVCPNSEIYYVLNITGFLQNILIFNNLEDAASSFTG